MRRAAEEINVSLLPAAPLDKPQYATGYAAGEAADTALLRRAALFLYRPGFLLRFCLYIQKVLTWFFKYIEYVYPVLQNVSIRINNYGDGAISHPSRLVHTLAYCVNRLL
jgi:hypothetical protein